MLDGPWGVVVDWIVVVVLLGLFLLVVFPRPFLSLLQTALGALQTLLRLFLFLLEVLQRHAPVKQKWADCKKDLVELWKSPSGSKSVEGHSTPQGPQEGRDAGHWVSDGSAGLKDGSVPLDRRRDGHWVS